MSWTGSRARFGAQLGWDDIWGKKHIEARLSVAKKKGEAECSAKYAAGSKSETKAQHEIALSRQCQKPR